jgi:hypothetical protein
MLRPDHHGLDWPDPIQAKQNIAEKQKYGNVPAWDKASGVKISKVTGSAWSPHRRFGRRGRPENILSRSSLASH